MTSTTMTSRPTISFTPKYCDTMDPTLDTMVTVTKNSMAMAMISYAQPRYLPQ